jgi:hypothetical protein
MQRSSSPGALSRALVQRAAFACSERGLFVVDAV